MATTQQLIAQRAAIKKRMSSAPRMPKAYAAESAFTYEFVSTAALAASGNVILTVNTDQDGDFYWHKGSIFADVANDGTVMDSQELPNLTMLITDGTTQRNLSNVPVSSANYFGTARQPFILSLPYYFAARALITMAVANVSDNKTYSSLRISMHGIKRFL